MFRFYNTLSRTVEDFKPNVEGKVSMYTCGPTVYHFAHIGNIRTYIMQDILIKSLEYAGYDVKRVMNITDVGHLSSDADTGEDKMVEGAKREHKTVMEIAKFYTDAFFKDFDAVGNKRPDVIEPATNCIPEFIHMVEVLLENENASQIVIFGKKGHAEVLGLVGQTESKAIVIESFDEVTTLDFSRDIYLYSQTTKSLDEFHRIIDYIQSHIAEGATFKSFDTICRSVANRMPNISSFATKHDLILFVCGRKSSNGKVLFNECLRVNPNSHLVEDPCEIQAEWLEGIQTVGICGATSTPRWLMEQCRDAILAKGV